MTKKEITIQGTQYPVVFDFQTILNFEEITGHSIFAADLSTMSSHMAMIMAAVLSADENSALTIEAIVGKKDFESVKQVLNAYGVIDALAIEFYKTPDVEKKNGGADTAGVDHSKN